MLQKDFGTFVPPTLDSSKTGQLTLPNIPAVKKSPVIAVSLRPLPHLEFEVRIDRRCKKPKVYSANILSANRMVQAINNLRHKNRAVIVPVATGWVAFTGGTFDETVCPPPREPERGGAIVKTFTTMEIWEAAENLIKRNVGGESDTAFANSYTTEVEAITLDLIQELTGIEPDFIPQTPDLRQTKYITSQETIIVPSVGFVPIIGKIVSDPKLGNRFIWNTGDDDNE